MEIKSSGGFRLVARYGRQIGLAESDAEECAARFYEEQARVVGSIECLEALWTSAPAQIRARASNFVWNHARALHRLARREGQWPQAEDEAGDSHPWDAPASDPDSGDAPQREAFWDLVLPALDTVRTEPRRWFLLHHLHGETFDTIAHAYGRTPNAVAVAIHRAGRRIAEELAILGISEEELRSYLPRPPAHDSLRYHADDGG